MAPNNSWNFISNGTTAYGIYNDDTGDVEELTGTINGNTITGTTTGGASFSGSFNGENVSGTWTNGSERGTWSGTRKM
ncbi:MAG: hypothetical protein ICV79_26375 [Flavisolibacter sp.]|nr:hypothetical protein [Flavisolibacter sp.]